MPLRGQGDNLRERAFRASTEVGEDKVINFLAKQVRARGPRPQLNIRLRELVQVNSILDKNVGYWVAGSPSLKPIGGLFEAVLRPSITRDFDFWLKRKAPDDPGPDITKIEFSGLTLSSGTIIETPDLSPEYYHELLIEMGRGAEVELPGRVSFSRVNTESSSNYQTSSLVVARVVEKVDSLDS